MTDSKPSFKPSAAQLRLLLPLLAAGLLLAAAWLAWTGWQQSADASRAQALEQSRDLAAQATARSLAQQQKRLQDRLASAPVQAALASGDMAAAAARLGEDWPKLQQARILPAELDNAYATLEQGGFGRLAVMEAALVAGHAAARIVKDDGVRLALAAPAEAGGQLVGIAYLLLPADLATAALKASDVAAGGYLALRQDSYTVLERGDTALAQTAEAMAVEVGDSNLRIAASLPDETAGAFGLGAEAAFIAAGVLVLLAVLALWFARRKPGGGSAELPSEAAQAPTLQEALQQSPPVAGTRAGEAAATATAATAAVVAAPARAGGVAVDPGIFRAYDVRGVVGKTLDIGVAELLGQAVGTVMHEQGAAEIVVGRDGRLSGPDMVAGLVEGLRKAGRNVIDIGMVPTPVVYFGTYELRTGCGIAVTGSHNPPDYNGFKIMVGGTTLSGDAITDLYTRISEGRLHVAENKGALSQRDISDDYLARIASDIQLDRRIKVVVDAGNGVAGELGPKVLKAIGAEVVPLYCEIDGTFPNHHPDPSEPHNLEDLVKAVAGEGAELGIAFDGDGDRLGVVTPSGANIFPDRLLMLFAADVLERNPGAVIVYDVKCSGRLPGHILRHGGSPLMWKTGHSLIKSKMREVEAELAGEMSGHFFFAERWYGFDDGIYSAARLLEIVAGRGESPGEILEALPEGVSTPEIKVDAPAGDPHAFVEKFRAAAQFEGARASTIDGLRIDWPDGWGLVRASNTTPVLVMRFDADTQEALERIQSQFRSQLLALDPGLSLPF
jgi:phosphomannomutase/phosphoglucomutase